MRLRYGLSGVHPTASINTVAGVEISRDVRMAEHVYIGAGCMINDGVSIGRYTMLAPRVAIVGVDHRMDVAGKPMIFSGRPESRPTVIGDDVWIGIGTVIMQGISIGRGAVIGANSFVNRDVPPFEIWVGTPARRVGERFPDPEQRRAHMAMLDGPPVRPSYCS
ncbi:MAG: acyltransferase [Planctomycetes bacterium]|nr:acyltransferase [Planctomycetota bacterium]